MTDASFSLAPPAAVEIDAVAYRRAHAGKLMIVSREEGKEPVGADFFHFDSVGTHPTGLFVTGIFDDGHRSHMKAAAVRDANLGEIAWRNGAENKSV